MDRPTANRQPPPPLPEEFATGAAAETGTDGFFANNNGGIPPPPSPPVASPSNNNTRLNSNDRALLVAVRHGMREHVQHLLQNGANLDARCQDDGKTALLVAAASNDTDMVTLLWQRFLANIHDTCPQGMTVRV